MGKNKYVGHRYIPIFENGWDKTRTYEPLTFVYYEGKTYVSRQLVPTNIEIENNDFWAFFMDNEPQIFTPTFTGQWTDKAYEPLSIVIDNGNTYVSKQNVPTGTVLTDETYWLDLSTYYNQLFIDYENAEQERQQAEAIRVENENQRKTDHANRSAELVGKADKVVIKNLIENGDFSEGTKGWMNGVYQTSFEVIDGVAKTVDFTIKNRSFIQKLTEQINIGDMIYVSINTRIDHPDKFRDMYILSDHSALSTNIIAGPITNLTSEFTKLSGTIRHKDVFNLRIIYTFVETGEYPAYLDDVVTINLTETFGAGNEPTKEEMDELIKATGYIDGEYALNNKEMLIWTLNLVRNNRNAIIALGGTI